MRRLHVPLLITGLALAGCAAPAPPPAASAERPDPPGWTRIQARGDFTVAIPPEFERRYVMGIDSAVDEFRTTGATFVLDYGLYGGGAVEDRGFTHRSQGVVEAGGRTGSWRLYRDTSAPADRPWGFRARFDALDQPPGHRSNLPPDAPRPMGVGLTIHGGCATQEACAVGRKIASTLRFGPRRPAPERLKLLRHTGSIGQAAEIIEGMVTMDSAGCLITTDNQGVAGPRLVWPPSVRVDASDPRLPKLAGGREGDTVELEGRDWVHATGVSIPDAAALPPPTLNRPAQPCGGPSFLISEWENAHSRYRRRAPEG
jgi:hypothetical protein